MKLCWKLSKQTLATAFFLLVICFPLNKAFGSLCTILRYLQMLGFVYSIYTTYRKRIYKIKWYRYYFALLIIMLISTIIVDLKDLKDCILLCANMFSATVLTENLFIKSTKKAIWVTALIWGAFMIAQYFTFLTGILGYIESNNGYNNANYFFGIRVEINQYIIYTLFFLLVLFISTRIITIKAFSLIIIALSVAFIISENVSTAIVGVLVFALVFSVSKIIRKRYLWKYAILLLLAVIAYFTISGNFEIFTDFLSEYLNEDVTLNGRILLWGQALEQLRDYHFITGYGFNPDYNLYISRYFVVNHPHNQYLQIFYNFGIFGFICYLIMLVKMINNVSCISNSALKRIYVATLISNMLICMSSRNYLYMPAQIFYVFAYHIADISDYVANISSKNKRLNKLYRGK